jgi:Zn-dependent peptidase ImmA (M78 family)
MTTSRLRQATIKLAGIDKKNRTFVLGLNMNLIDLYNLIDKNNIQLMSCDFRTLKAACLSQDNLQAICVDYRKIISEREEKEILAEEYSHLEKGYLYRVADVFNPLYEQNVRKTEIRARRHAAALLVSVDDIKTAFRTGRRHLWEIAEYLDVSENTVKTAIEHYYAQGLL